MTFVRVKNWLSGSLRVAQLGLGLALVMAAVASPAYALPPPTPEIDPGSVGSAAALLVGGLLILTDRLRRRK